MTDFGSQYASGYDRGKTTKTPISHSGYYRSHVNPNFIGNVDQKTLRHGREYDRVTPGQYSSSSSSSSSLPPQIKHEPPLLQTHPPPP